MKQKLHLLSLLAFCVLSNLLNSQTLQWAKQMGGIESDYGISTDVDASGNVYSTGWFSGTADFDPNSGISNLIAAGSDDIFVSKFDASGNFIWAKQIGGTGSDEGTSTKLDNMGNIYVTGHFEGSVDFDPGSGTNTLTSAGDYDIFILKLNTAGNFVWAKQMGGVNLDNAYSIAIDLTGSIYTIGSFSGNVDFDPGTGTSNLVSSGADDIFISKLDASGTFVWAKRMGGTGNDYGSCLTLDASGNMYATGSFQGTVDFDPGAGTTNLTSASSDDIYVSKFDISGNFVWAKSLGGIGEGTTIAVDSLGNVYTGGNFLGSADFDPGANTFNLTAIGSVDIFISKLDASGNFIWAKAIGGSGSEYSASLALDASGNVFITGTFSGIADLNPGTGTFNLTSAGGQDVFIAELDNLGNFLWANGIGSSGTDYGISITFDITGSMYVTGTFGGAADFDPSAGTANLNSVGMGDIFVMKFSVPTAGISDAQPYKNSIALYPNPTNGVFTVASENRLSAIHVTNIMGEVVHSIQQNYNKTTIDLSGYPEGVYFLRFVIGGNTVGVTKLVLAH